MAGVAGITVVNCAIGLWHFSRTKDRLVYWL
jgi:hypothetical protein